jgi:hypothetical protein
MITSHCIFPLRLFRRRRSGILTPILGCLVRHDGSPLAPSKTPSTPYPRLKKSLLTEAQRSLPQPRPANLQPLFADETTIGRLGSGKMSVFLSSSQNRKKNRLYRSINSSATIVTLGKSQSFSLLNSVVIEYISFWDAEPRFSPISYTYWYRLSRVAPKWAECVLDPF